MEKNMSYNERRFWAVLSILNGKAASGKPIGAGTVRESITGADILMNMLSEKDENPQKNIKS